MDRIKRSEKSTKVPNIRTQKLRSRKPQKVKLVKKTELTQEELDFQKYVVNI